MHILQILFKMPSSLLLKEGNITVQAYLSKEGFFVHVIDEGIGIDESKDLFAPFKRYGNQTGAGLGLFLAKNAADAIGAKITLQNREDAKGTIATLLLPLRKRSL